MTRDELSKYDGRDGRPAYVAVNGKVYDFTASKLWPGGDHQGAHQAGCDLTDALQKAPHVRAVIERFPVVGTLDSAAQEPFQKNLNMIYPVIFFLAAMLIGIFLYTQ